MNEFCSTAKNNSQIHQVHVCMGDDVLLEFAFKEAWLKNEEEEEEDEDGGAEEKKHNIVDVVVVIVALKKKRKKTLMLTL